MRCARRAKVLLHTLGNARVIAQQDASEKRSLRFGQDLHDGIVGVRLERIQPSERRKTLIMCQHIHARARHERIHALSSEVLAIGKVRRVGRRLEFAFGANPVTVAVIGKRGRLDEDQSLSPSALHSR